MKNTITEVDIGKEYGLCQFCEETWQGEGPEAGQLITLIRFKECNLNCPFCDTQTLMKRAPISLTFDEVREAVVKTQKLLITGGEPLGVQENAGAAVNLVTALRTTAHFYEQSFSVSIETNGVNCHAESLEAMVKLTIPLVITWGLKPGFLRPGRTLHQDGHEIYTLNLSLVWAWQDFMCRLASAGVFSPENSNRIKIIVKIVWPDPVDESILDTIQELAKSQREIGRNLEVWIMPLGHTRELVLKNGVEALEVAKRHHFNFSSRLHIIHNFD